MVVGIWGGGFIGGSLSRELVAQGIDVCILNRSGGGAIPSAEGSLTTRQMAFDATEVEMVRALSGLSVLVHCAGSASDGYDDYFKAAVRMARAAVAARLKRVVLMSTVAVYGAAIPEQGISGDPLIGKSTLPRPLTPYAQSRYDAELELRRILEGAGIELIVVRIPMAVGQGMNATIFNKLYTLLKVGLFPRLQHSNALLPCIGIARLSRCLAAVVCQEVPSAKIYQFADSVSWLSIINLYTSHTGHSIRRFPLPGRLLHWLAEQVGLKRTASSLRSMMNTARYEDDSALVLGSDSVDCWPTTACVERGLLNSLPFLQESSEARHLDATPLHAEEKQKARLDSSQPYPSRQPVAPSSMVAFLLFFSYATAAALIFQNLLLPMVGGSHFGHGLIQGDSAYFHSVAVELAERIRQEGWSAWRVYPTAGARGNTGILAALYVLFGNTPSVMVPINAAIHALAGIVIMQLGRMLWPGRVGMVGGAIAACLFIAFPSALNWYGQIHKDGFAIAGTTLFLYAWLRAEHSRRGAYADVVTILYCLAGIGLIAFVRPYSLKIMLLGVIAMLACATASLFYGRRPAGRRIISTKLLLTVVLGVSVFLASQIGDSEELPYAGWSGAKLTTAQQDKLGAYRQKIINWHWQKSDWAPRLLDHYAEAVARTRIGLIVSGLQEGAESLYDIDRIPDSLPSLIAYTPRALQIAMFAPFPSKWLEKRSVARLVSIGEMLIWYAAIPGVFLALIYRRSFSIVALVAFAMVLMSIYGLTLANVGSLYRIRYIYLFLLLLVGAMGWLGLAQARGWFSSVRTDEQVGGEEILVKDATHNLTQMRSELLGAGMMVAVVTALTFLGLFLRDVLMARMFGLSSELDAFVSATVIPMLLVSVISVPIGTAIVPIITTIKQMHSADDAIYGLARRIAIVFTIFSTAVAAILLFAAPSLIEGIWSGSTDKANLTYGVTCWMLAVFVVSGLMTMANGILNAMGLYVLPAFAQAIVPLVAIAALLFFGVKYGVIAVAVAMFAGQILNLACVCWALSKVGLPAAKIIRSTGGPVRLRDFMTLYFPLAAAAIFMQLGVPVGTVMASFLPEGSVAALGLGSKAVLFITGLIAAVMTSVVLPYFSTHLAENRLPDARRELSFLLLTATVVTVPASLILHMLVDPFVTLVFKGGVFSDAEGGVLSHVMAYGILQLPFFVTNLLLLKFSIASRCSGQVMLAALFGLLVNIAAGLALVNRFGVAGIALSITIAAAASAFLILLLFWRRGDVEVGDMVLVITNWILFLAMAICIHYASYIGFSSALLAFLSLTMGARMHVVRNHFQRAIPGAELAR